MFADERTIAHISSVNTFLMDNDTISMNWEMQRDDHLGAIFGS